MAEKVLIVEDEFLIALAIEGAVVELGMEIAGMAASRKQALLVDEPVDIALVDVNLTDGPTGPEVGRVYAEKGATVVFMTANPSMVADGVPGAVGYMSKPVFDLDVVCVLQYLSDRHRGVTAVPPRSLKLYEKAA